MLETIKKKKEEEPNSYKMINYLSFPQGNLLNDQIHPALSSLSYTSFDKVISLLRTLGPNALLAKADIKSAFRLQPNYLSSFHFFGIYFENKLFFGKCLPMGRSLYCAYF